MPETSLPSSTPAETGLGDKLGNDVGRVLDGVSEVADAFNVTDDPNAKPDPKEGLGTKVLNAAQDVVGMAVKPADVVRQVAGEVVWGAGADIVKQTPGSHTIDAVKKVGTNIARLPVDLPKGLACGAWKIVSGVGLTAGHLVSAPFQGGNPAPDLPKPRAGSRDLHSVGVASARQTVAANHEEDPTHDVAANSKGAPHDIIPIGVRAPAAAMAMAPRPHGPGF